MAEEAKKSTAKRLTKKQARKQIYDKLMPVLSEYKNGTDTKKFDRRLQKASKLFAPLLIKEKSAKPVKEKSTKKV